MMALGKAPGEAVGLASQPTMSRWENAPNLRTSINAFSPSAPVALTAVGCGDDTA
jgi:hypothetical protein